MLLKYFFVVFFVVGLVIGCVVGFDYVKLEVLVFD